MVRYGGLSMYEISTRPWLHSLSQKYGRQIAHLASIPKEEFQAIADLGFDMVWMMGIWELGEYALKFDKNNKGLLEKLSRELPDGTHDDIIGSPYAVVNYRCNPQIGSDADIAAMRKTMNEMGLLLMLDYVPNHTAVDCPLVSDPENYVQVEKHTNPPFDSSRYLPSGIAYGWAGWGDSWKDTAQVNIWNAKTRNIRTSEVMHIASMCDAVRCDMAFLMLNSEFEKYWGAKVGTRGYTKPATEWWADTITHVKSQFPNFIFLAEVYHPCESVLQLLGFDYTYDKTLYDKVKRGNLDEIKGWIAGNSEHFVKHSAHFISNHDEERGPRAFGSWWRSNAAALLSFTLPGMRFFWMGDLEGHEHSLAVHFRRARKEETVEECYAFYKKLLSIINTPIFKHGQWEYLEVKGDNCPLIAYHWMLENERRLCVINFSDQQKGWGSIVLPLTRTEKNAEITLTDLLSGEKYERKVEEVYTKGLHVGVNSWYAAIFQY